MASGDYYVAFIEGNVLGVVYLDAVAGAEDVGVGVGDGGGEVEIHF